MMAPVISTSVWPALFARLTGVASHLRWSDWGLDCFWSHITLADKWHCGHSGGISVFVSPVVHDNSKSLSTGKSRQQIENPVQCGLRCAGYCLNKYREEEINLMQGVIQGRCGSKPEGRFQELACVQKRVRARSVEAKASIFHKGTDINHVFIGTNPDHRGYSALALGPSGLYELDREEGQCWTKPAGGGERQAVRCRRSKKVGSPAPRHHREH